MEKRVITLAEAGRLLRCPEGEKGVIMGERMNSSNRIMYEMTLDFLELKPGDQVLEIGMGNGYFIPALFEREPAIHYTGLDFSEVMVKAAKEKQGERVTIVQGEAAAMPFPSAQFNKVFAVNVLYFWHPPETALQEIFRVLKPGGEIIMSFRTKRSMEQLPFIDPGFILYEANTVKTLLQNIGFQVTETITAVEPSKPTVDGRIMAEMENICMRGIKN